MAKLRDGLLFVEEMPNDPAEVFMVANVFGRSPARDYQSYVVRRIHVFKSQVGIPGIARLLGIGVEAGLEIVDNEAELFLCWRRNSNFCNR